MSEKRPWLRWYGLARWKHLREAQLAAEPLCEWCLESERVTEATEVHHAEAHRGDETKFWSGPFISTCRSCHSRRGQLEDHGKTVIRYDASGWPI